jgi:hypothetical protein
MKIILIEERKPIKMGHYKIIRKMKYWNEQFNFDRTEEAWFSNMGHYLEINGKLKWESKNTFKDKNFRTIENVEFWIEK